MKKLILIFCAFLFSTSISFGAIHYIDVDCPNNGDGTEGECGAAAGAGAYNAVPTLSGQNSYYFKCGTLIEATGAYVIDLNNDDGISGTRTIIGAYYMSDATTEVIGVSGIRPILDRTDTDGTADIVVYVRYSDYVTIQNVIVRGGAGYGQLKIIDSDNVIVEDSDFGSGIASAIQTYAIYVRAADSDDEQNGLIIRDNTIIPEVIHTNS